MTEKTKIGPRVDEAVYEQFVNEVEERFGRTHGVVGRELERAMLEYIDSSHEDPQLNRIESDIATLSANMADLADAVEAPVADGGATTLSNAVSNTHTSSSGTEDPPHVRDTSADEDGGHDRDDTDDPEPSPVRERPLHEHEADEFSTTADRTDYLESVVRANHENEQATREDLVEVVRDEYGFGDRTIEKYTDRLVDRLEAEPHPAHGKFLVWGDTLESALEDLREQVDDAARDREEELADAERGEDS